MPRRTKKLQHEQAAKAFNELECRAFGSGVLLEDVEFGDEVFRAGTPTYFVGFVTTGASWGKAIINLGGMFRVIDQKKLLLKVN